MANRILAHSRLDLSECRSSLEPCEILEILLSIKKGIRPGPNGVPGIAYKRAAKFLIQIFAEALHQLQRPDTEVPETLKAALWVPIGKVENPVRVDQIRDLELPNEGRKIISHDSEAVG